MDISEETSPAVRVGDSVIWMRVRMVGSYIHHHTTIIMIHSYVLV